MLAVELGYVGPPARVGHATGGEVTRHIGRHGTSRVSKLARIGGVPRMMVKTESNPGGLPIDVLDGIRSGGGINDRSQFYKDLTAPFLGANRAGSKLSQGMRYDCIKQFSETDFTEDLKKVDVPTTYQDHVNAILLAFVETR